MHRGKALGHEPLPFGSQHDPVAHEGSEGFLVEMLQLAAAAARKMATRRIGAVRPRRDRAVGPQPVAGRGERDVAARRGDAVAFRRHSQDIFAFAHRQAA